jgi:HEAT repeat protein
MKRVLVAVLALGCALAAPARSPDPDEVDEAVARLFAAARSGDERACMNAAGSLVAFKDVGASKLAGSLEGRTAVELVWALRCLRAIGGPAAAGAASTLATHADAAVRAEAVWTAYDVSGAVAWEVLVSAARDGDPIVRRRAFDGLAQHACSKPGVAAVAIEGILDRDSWVMLAAFQILHAQPVAPDPKADPVIPGVTRILPRLDERNAKAAFRLLVRRAGQGCGAAIEGSLDAEREAIVLAALEAAGDVRLTAAVPRCARLASGSDLVVARAAIECLARINDPSTLPFLVDQLEQSRDRERTDALAAALRRMTGRLYGTDVPRWRVYLEQRRG